MNLIFSNPSSQELTKSLSENGTVVIKNFLDPEVFNTLKNETDKYLQEKVNLDIAPNKTANFPALRKSNKTIINKRFKERDGDEGMIDIWNIDKEIPTTTPLEQIKEFTLNLIHSTFPPTEYFYQTTNFYLNNSVTHTRGIHSDSGVFPSRIKAFLYMTDITDIYDGPYSYILGSHRGIGKKYWKKHDIYNPLTEDKENYQVFEQLNKNDLIISCVAGAHRGLPQKVGRERQAYVLSFDPKGHAL